MERPLTKNIRDDQEPCDLKQYEKAGGYQAVRTALKEFEPAEVTELVKKANLKGRGGAGFNTGMKWGFVPLGDDAPRPRYLVANADEMEPGTFKDRLLMEGDPHQLIEGMILAAYAIQAEIAYIFIRWAYIVSQKRLMKAIAEAYEQGYLGKNILGSDFSLEMHVHVSAGRYMCGEETGLLNALEGKRATPRAKPPFPQLSGLWGKPTIVQNVETLCNVPHIINNGAEWYLSLSLTEDGGTKIYGASGHVKEPGAWELPMGTPVRELLEEHAGGMQDGRKFKGLLPGGASTDFLVEEHLDTPMDFASIQKAGSRLGTGTMIVLDDKTCPVGMVHNMQKFFAQESCGWCTPCRDGLPWVRDVLEAIEQGTGEEGDLDMLSAHSKWLGPGNTFCALAPGAVEPLQSAIKYFREDFETHIRDKRCPYRKT
ncbi:NADH-quinone oxidoreductase subunit NuoF [candidate division KSB1 bacterium]|nr:NADH-quinone oxidoreductase subunit NuoF [candidate division KSB1 bacterium]NIR70759.1 NADH-quinone oxidoreductase subunit NuoF [candidate division KSB1 bacterium]NIS23212.1 NADH-quinone oxidoreductase subunit NuoF [candidate division KSB1 bacterium]NIT70072.1 NADH-quinone oxidoreductase subunit NuoF [candidate division KSB1 bacterium]NIU23709.1 NADH-quinone oxidoreductase subunit NuoF [candidate division KSB1 bacterium]